MDKIKVLCVEDELPIADLISSLLDKKVYSIKHIIDGKEALDLLLTTNESPDIVLLDFTLPSLNGIEILKELKKVGKKYAIIFLSVQDSIDMVIQAMREGALDYLVKNQNFKSELNIRVGKAYHLFQARRKSEFFEQAYQDKTNELNHFFSAVPDLLCIIDEKGKFRKLNNAWESTLGYAINELIEQPYLHFIHPDDQKYTADATLHLLKTGILKNLVNRCLCKDGSYKYIEWSCVADKNLYFYCSAHDITEQRLREQAMQESETRFRGIFETVNAGISIIGKNDFILMSNSVFQKMLEFKKHELKNITFFELAHPEDSSEIDIQHQKLIKGEIDHYNIEKRFISKSGKIIWVDLAVAPVLSESKRLIYFIAVIHDITQRKYYEQQLIEMNSTKDKFFSIIGHDLRNQFSSISLLTEFLIEKDSLDEAKREEFLSLLHSTGKSALGLLENLLEWSRTQINKVELVPENVNLSNLVTEVFSVLNNQAFMKEISIVNEVEEGTIVFCDKHMISTVLRNLINNAVKYTNQNGRIIVSAKTYKDKNVISVKDNGVGIPGEIADKLFKISAKSSMPGTHNEKGTGLGLVLCKEFIDMHGGEITVQSKVNSGSEFLISLPFNYIAANSSVIKNNEEYYGKYKIQYQRS